MINLCEDMTIEGAEMAVLHEDHHLEKEMKKQQGVSFLLVKPVITDFSRRAKAETKTGFDSTI